MGDKVTCVVFQVISADVQLAEQFRRNPVIAALREVARADEVAAAEVHADVHVGGDVAQTVVVQLNVAVKQGVGVLAVGAEAGEHLFGAEVWLAAALLVSTCP